MSETELKPCPFCGASAEWEYNPWNEDTETGDDGSGKIECNGCHAVMQAGSRDEAEAKWNTRAALAAAPAQPVAWAATNEGGDVEALGMNKSRRFDTPLFTAPQPTAQAKECGNCFEGKSDMHHDCAKCGGTGQAQAQDARKRLTDEALDLMCEQALFGRISMQQFARSIESVHGIR